MNRVAEGSDGRLVLTYLETAGLLRFINRESIRPSREGIVFEFNNRAAAILYLDRHPAFRTRTPFGSEHTNQVGGRAIDYRSFTVGREALGTKSLQLCVGPSGTIPANSVGALGYADLDEANPAEDVVSLIRHGAPLFARLMGRLFQRVFSGRSSNERS